MSCSRHSSLAFPGGGGSDCPSPATPLCSPIVLPGVVRVMDSTGKKKKKRKKKMMMVKGIESVESTVQQQQQ